MDNDILDSVNKARLTRALQAQNTCPELTACGLASDVTRVLGPVLLLF